MLDAFAPAKVNLALHVLGRRPDGYHLLDSLVVFAFVGDTLAALPAETLTLGLQGRFGAALAGTPDNLVLRAARLLASEAGVAPRAQLILRKELPVASGIGGGSADAAATLRLLSRLWQLDVPAADLAALGLRLGADVPVCLAGQPARMGGIGEVLAPVPELPPCGIALINSGVAMSTQSVFRRRRAAFSRPLELPQDWPDAAALAATVAGAGNDLQEAAVGLVPEIGDVLAALEARPGCLVARMSGSGATCFGLFTTPAEAQAAASALHRPDWWVWGGALFRERRGLARLGGTT